MNRIALMERGQCSFKDKLELAESHGAMAVLMFTDSRPKASMGGQQAEVTLHAGMIDREPGLKARDLLLAGTTISATMEYVLIGLDGKEVP